MKQPYSDNHTPAAPVLQIRLVLPGHNFGKRYLSALVDTGADLVIVPTRALNQLRSEAVNYVRMRGQWNEPREMELHTLDIEIGSLRYPAINVVADDQGSEIILGRNLLNKLVITLNGPEQELQIRA